MVDIGICGQHRAKSLAWRVDYFERAHGLGGLRDHRVAGDDDAAWLGDLAINANVLTLTCGFGGGSRLIGTHAPQPHIHSNRHSPIVEVHNYAALTSPSASREHPRQKERSPGLLHRSVGGPGLQDGLGSTHIDLAGCTVSVNVNHCPVGPRSCGAVRVLGFCFRQPKPLERHRSFPTLPPEGFQIVPDQRTVILTTWARFPLPFTWPRPLYSVGACALSLLGIKVRWCRSGGRSLGLRSTLLGEIGFVNPKIEIPRVVDRISPISPEVVKLVTDFSTGGSDGRHKREWVRGAFAWNGS